MLTKDTARAIVADVQRRMLEGEDSDAIASATYRALLVYSVKLKEGYGEWNDARQFAESTGRFWLFCPLCGHWYGGHEGGGGAFPLTPWEGVGTCPAPECVAEAKRIAAAYPDGVQLRGD